MADRVENWKRFSQHMEQYIESHTIDKYGLPGGVDLMEITAHPIVCLFNILKYAFRIWTGNMKLCDLEKIAHYTEMAWTISEGKIIGITERESAGIKVLQHRRD